MYNHQQDLAEIEAEHASTVDTIKGVAAPPTADEATGDADPGVDITDAGDAQDDDDKSEGQEDGDADAQDDEDEGTAKQDGEEDEGTEASDGGDDDTTTADAAADEKEVPAAAPVAVA